MALRRQSWSALLILVLIGMAFAQMAAWDPSHSGDDESSHCCAICHTGHYSILHSVAAAILVFLALICWHDAPAAVVRLIEQQIAPDYSRPPPA